jgi:hypothetical protein
MGFEKGSSPGPSASCWQGRSPVEVSGSRASFGQRAPTEGRSSNEGSLRRPGHEQQRLHAMASDDGELRQRRGSGKKHCEFGMARRRWSCQLLGTRRHRGKGTTMAATALLAGHGHGFSGGCEQRR